MWIRLCPFPPCSCPPKIHHHSPYGHRADSVSESPLHTAIHPFSQALSFRYHTFIRRSSARPPPSTSREITLKSCVVCLNHFSQCWRPIKYIHTHIPWLPQYCHVSPNKSSLKPSTPPIKLLAVCLYHQEVDVVLSSYTLGYFLCRSYR